MKKLNKKSNPYLVYKWVRKRAYDQNKNIINKDPFADLSNIDKPLEEKNKSKKERSGKDKLAHSVQSAKSVNKVRAKESPEVAVKI